MTRKTSMKVVALPGDGIGPEVTSVAVEVLRATCRRFGHALEVCEAAIGGAALRKGLPPLPDETRRLALEADAVFLGAVGDPELEGEPPERRPERGLLALRKALGVYANLRPIQSSPRSADASPLKASVVAGTDLLIVRELTGGLYYGEPRGITGEGAQARAVDTMAYTTPEIERIAEVAFEIARGRRRHVTSVDKVNVLATSQLWRRVVTDVSRRFEDVTLDHALVDSFAMQLLFDPRRFDVVLTENLFGDILSDEAAALVGSIGMLPSASLGARHPSGARVGLYEPVHGSAPDLAGKNVANPIGAIASVAALFEYGFGLLEEATAVRSAIASVLERGLGTPDIAPADRASTTRAVGEAVQAAIG